MVCPHPFLCDPSFSQATSSRLMLTAGPSSSLLCTHTPSLSSPVGKLCSETPLLCSALLCSAPGAGTVQLEWCGRWPARGCHGNSWISFIPPPRFPRDYTKMTEKITARNQRTLFSDKISWPFYMFPSANPWHPCCWYNNLVIVSCM